MGPLHVKMLAFALLAGAVTCAALFADRAAPALSAAGRRALTLGASVVALLAFARDVFIARSASLHPPHWDFLCFFLYGHIALGSRGVYDPAAFAAAYARYATPDSLADPSFVPEAIAVALPYPPFSIPLFAPLGAIADYRAAAAVWLGVMLVAILAAAALFARTFLQSGGPLAFALALAVVGFSHGVLWDLGVAQTIPLALLATIAAFAAPKARGYWLALGIVVKPFLAVLLAVPLLERRFGTIARAAAGLALALALALALVGPAQALRYVAGGPLTRVPPSAYMESINPSLSAVLLRALHPVPPQTITLAIQLPYLLTAAVFALMTLAVAWRAAARGADDFAASIVLIGGLMLFPSTLPFYTALVLVPIGVAWRRARDVPGSAIGVALASGSLAASLGTDDGTLTFCALLALWVAYGVWIERSLAARDASFSISPSYGASQC